MLEHGIPIEAIVTELVLSGEVERTYRLLREVGLRRAVGVPLARRASTASCRGGAATTTSTSARRWTSSPTTSRPGAFADEWDAERDAGYPVLAALKEQHAGPMVRAFEADLRSPTSGRASWPAGAEHVPRFTNRVAIVTGGGLRHRPRDRACCSRAKAPRSPSPTSARDAAARVVAEIEAAGGHGARAGRRRGRRRRGRRRWCADTVAAFGGLDVLHNNAAALDQNRLDQDVVDDGPRARGTACSAVNLTGPMLGCRFAIPAMLERGGGCDRQHRVGRRVLRQPLARRVRHVEGRASSRSRGTSRPRTASVASAATRSRPASSSTARRQDALGGPMGDRLRRYSTSHLDRPARLSRGDRGGGRVPRVRRRRVRHRRDPARRRRVHRAHPDVRD